MTCQSELRLSFTSSLLCSNLSAPLLVHEGCPKVPLHQLHSVSTWPWAPARTSDSHCKRCLVLKHNDCSSGLRLGPAECSLQGQEYKRASGRYPCKDLHSAGCGIRALALPPTSVRLLMTRRRACAGCLPGVRRLVRLLKAERPSQIRMQAPPHPLTSCRP